MIQYILSEIGFILLSFVIPIFAIFVPVRRVKYIEKNNNKNNIITILILTFIVSLFSILEFKNIYFTVVYLSLYVLPSFCYIYFSKLEERYKKSLGILDYIVLGSLISSIILFAVYYFNLKEVSVFLQETKQFYYSFMKLDKSVVDEMFRQMEFYIPAGIYFSAFIIYYYVYAFFKKSQNSEWKISYVYIIVYIVAQLLNQFVLKENIYLMNILNVVKLGYIVFGGIIAYSFIFKASKSRVLAMIMTVINYLMLSDVLFVVGAIFSFFPKRESEKKEIDEENKE